MIVQDESTVGRLDSIIVCLITSDPLAPGKFRVSMDCTPENGLSANSIVMVEKVASMPKQRIGRTVGRASAEIMAAVDDALMLLLGLSRDAPV